MDEIAICELIALQRALAQSDDQFLRCVGTLWIAGEIEKRLPKLTDRQIGQLFADYIEARFHIVYPEATIFRNATKRLLRSERGCLEEREKEHPPCPICGNEMLLRYGIDEPDFHECVIRSCGHKEYITVASQEDEENDR